MITFDATTLFCYEDGREVGLTVPQWRMVLALTKAKRPLPRRELEVLVYGRSEVVAIGTLSTAVHKLRRKFNRTVIYYNGGGYVWVGR